MMPVLSRLRAVRDGELSKSDFITRQQGEGKMAEAIWHMFELFCRKYGLNRPERLLSTDHFTIEGARQLCMF